MNQLCHLYDRIKYQYVNQCWRNMRDLLWRITYLKDAGKTWDSIWTYLFINFLLNAFRKTSPLELQSKVWNLYLKELLANQSNSNAYQYNFHTILLLAIHILIWSCQVSTMHRMKIILFKRGSTHLRMQFYSYIIISVFRYQITDNIKN